VRLHTMSSPRGLDHRGGPKAQVEEFGEVAPWWRALITLDLDVPQLGRGFKVVGSHPNLLHDALLMEIGFAAVNER
jgi:hypothetical protein